MAERDDRRREPPGKGRSGQPAGRGRRQPQGGGRQPPEGDARRRPRERDGDRQRRDRDGRSQPRERDGAGPPSPAPSHNLSLEVGGHGVELHCDTCGLVVTHLAAPQVRRAVEEAHRRHLGTLTWESAWVAVCSCGWRTGRLNQQAARQQLADHEESMLRPPAQGESPPPG